MKESYVYILASKYNGTLYIGMTSDLVKRVWEHKNKFVSGFTAQYKVTNLVYYEIFNDIQLAVSIPQHNSVNGPRGLRRGDSAVEFFHKVETKKTCHV